MSIEIPIIPSPPTFRPMREANALQGDKTALWRQFESDGYLFFRDVLDLEAIRRLQAEFAVELSKQGLINEGDKDFRYTGADLSGIRKAGGALLPADALHEREPWRAFAAHPAVHRFLSDLIGDEPFWLPIVEYKAVPPAKPGPTRFNFVHQDSFYNKGISSMTCWVPVSDIPAEVGGIACAEGMHKGSFHNPNDPPAFFVPRGAIPDESWVRGDYRPGDLLIMHIGLPHSGLTNHSDRFRLSMDVRFVPKSGAPPIVGKLVSVTSNRIVVKGDDGRLGDYVIDDNTTFRNYGLGLVDRSNVGELYQPGDDLIVAMEEGRATVIRRTSAAAYLKEIAIH